MGVLKNLCRIKRAEPGNESKPLKMYRESRVFAGIYPATRPNDLVAFRFKGGIYFAKIFLQLLILPNRNCRLVARVLGLKI